MKHLCQYRESLYEQMMGTVYLRRGWEGNSVPTVEKLKELGFDLPEVVEVMECVGNC